MQTLTQLCAVALTLVAVSGATVQADPLLKVTGGNYVVTEIDPAARTFGADLVQNGPTHTRVKVQVNKDARCWMVVKGQTGPTRLNVDKFMHSLHSGTRVKLNAGRALNGHLNASELWAQ